MNEIGELPMEILHPPGPTAPTVGNRTNRSLVGRASPRAAVNQIDRLGSAIPRKSKNSEAKNPKAIANASGVDQ